MAPGTGLVPPSRQGILEAGLDVRCSGSTCPAVVLWPCWPTLCPPLVLLLSFACPSVVLWLRRPTLCPPLVLFLSSLSCSCPLAALANPVSPFFLLSCCCRALYLRFFPRQGVGLWPTTTTFLPTKLFWGLCWYSISRIAKSLVVIESNRSLTCLCTCNSQMYSSLELLDFS